MLDIKQTFLNVVIPDEDRDYLHFFYGTTIHFQPNQTLLFYIFSALCLYLLFRGIISLSYLLNATSKYH